MESKICEMSGHDFDNLFHTGYHTCRRCGLVYCDPPIDMSYISIYSMPTQNTDPNKEDK